MIILMLFLMVNSSSDSLDESSTECMILPELCPVISKHLDTKSIIQFSRTSSVFHYCLVPRLNYISEYIKNNRFVLSESWSSPRLIALDPNEYAEDKRWLQKSVHKQRSFLYELMEDYLCFLCFCTETNIPTISLTIHNLRVLAYVSNYIPRNAELKLTLSLTSPMERLEISEITQFERMFSLVQQLEIVALDREDSIYFLKLIQNVHHNIKRYRIVDMNQLESVISKFMDPFIGKPLEVFEFEETLEKRLTEQCIQFLHLFLYIRSFRYIEMVREKFGGPFHRYDLQRLVRGPIHLVGRNK